MRTMIPHMPYPLRNLNAAVIGWCLRQVPFRFSKDYRWELTHWHAWVYALVNTIAANAVADGRDFREALFWGYARQSRYVR